jgi:two-component system, OmpR family, KDP operon response regulator KdpE
MKVFKVLIIEDEVAIRRLLKISLEPTTYHIIEAETASLGLTLAASHKPDIILLDIGLPDLNGFEVIQQLREWYTRPLLVLTVHDQEDEKVKALDLGADDYLTKPFSVAELQARIRVLLRRTSSESSFDSVFKNGDLFMDKSAHIVKVKDQEVHLTTTEFDLLATLVKHAGKVVTHRMLLNEVWGPSSVEHVQYLRVYMGQIRKKLNISSSTKEIILTEPGVGYRLNII